MTTQSYRKLKVWEKGVELNMAIYQSLKESNESWIVRQLLRASLSIPSNIAEGYNRSTNKELIRYLHIATGSCAEVQTQLIIALRLGLIEQANGVKLIERATSLLLMLSKLISVRKNEFS